EALADDDKEDYQLRRTGRYAHRRSYIQQLLTQHGFKQLDEQTATLRTQEGEAVMGYIFVLQKTA
ncbi:MAG TPA: hypothetical protein PLD88_12055, partial [Candidatus Berkiella sp.]|nr:hypothetical protein [Candidatus Berkiella sp.]